jgi:putative modified peptide
MTTKFTAEVAERLLDKLATDDAFRASFATDPRAALRLLGHETPLPDYGIAGRDPVLPLQVLNGGLASKEKIAAGRERMLATFQADYRPTDSQARIIFSMFDFCVNSSSPSHQQEISMRAA